MSDFVSEAGHWYDQEGKPAYTQEVKTGKRKGEERNTTIRDARKLDLVPSVTSILGILDKPALTHWLCNRAADRAIAAERGVTFFEDDSAEKGSAIHAAIEDWIETDSIDLDYVEYAEICKNVFKEVGVTKPVSERSFTSPHGYGGAVDLHDKEANVIIDFKTKDISKEDIEKGKKFYYDEHAAQLAAYRMGLEMPTAKCYNLFLSRTNPKEYVLHEWAEEDIKHASKLFVTLHNAWKLIKKFGEY